MRVGCDKNLGKLRSNEHPSTSIEDIEDVNRQSACQAICANESMNYAIIIFTRNYNNVPNTNDCLCTEKLYCQMPPGAVKRLMKKVPCLVCMAVSN